MRAQAHTLEGVAAAFLVVTSVVIALQVTAVTPLTASTASQHIETQESGSAAGLLLSSRADHLIRSTLLYWNESTSQFHKSGENGYYTFGGPPTAFGRQLNQTFGESGYAFNVYARYATVEGNVRERRVVYMGKPSDHAAAASYTVTLYDSDHLLDEAHRQTEKTLASVPYFAEDVSESSHVYVVVEVEVVVWRM